MTLPELQDRLTLYLAAEKAILEGGQEWDVDGEKFTRAELPALQTEIRRLRHEIAMLERVQAGGAPICFSQGVFGGRR